MYASPPPATQPQPEQRKPRRFTWRFFADMVAFATAVISLVVAILAGVSRNQAQDEAASLNDQIASLDAEISSLTDERDQLQEELDASPTPEDTPTSEGTEESPAAETSEGTGYLELSGAVDTAPCSTGAWGEWTAEGVQLAGDQYWSGFACEAITSRPEPPSGYVDFLVPDSATRVTGMAGFDDRSADTTMTAEFLVLSVPATDTPLFSKVLAFGEVAEINVDIAEFERVRFEVRVRASEYLGDGSLDNLAALSWADMKFE